MQRLVTWWDPHQVALYLAAILLGVVIGVLVPGAAATFAVATNPVLGLMLFATFLGVPLIEIGRSFRDLRFLGTVLVVNFVVVPIVVFGLSRFVADDRGLLIGVLLHIALELGSARRCRLSHRRSRDEAYRVLTPPGREGRL